MVPLYQLMEEELLGKENFQKYFFKMKEVYGLITVRSESSRLPRKCFLPLGDMCVLESIVHRKCYAKLLQ